MLPGEGIFGPQPDTLTFRIESTHVAIGVELYDSHTGDHVCYLDTYHREHLGSVPFMYQEGNYGCDCNRTLFVDRAFALPDADVVARRCSHDRVYVVRVVRRDTKAELYEGDEHPIVDALRETYG